MKNLLLSFILISSQLLAQINVDHRFNIYYGMGASVPLSTFSKSNRSYNAFGKAQTGFNLKAGGEYIIDPQNAISIDFELSLLGIKNDSLNLFAKHRLNTYSLSVFAEGTNTSDLEMLSYSLGYSRFFNVDKITIQTKLGLGIINFVYDYRSTYILSNYSPTLSSAPNFSNADFYTGNFYSFLVKPEVGFKYIFKEMDYVDWIIGFNASYFYLNPKVKLYSSMEPGPLTQLSDKVHIVTLNLSLQLALTKPAFDKMKEYLSNMPMWHY